MILWVDSPRARDVFAAASRRGVLKIWVGSDAWSGRTSVTDGYEDVVRGAVTLQPLAARIQDFDRYFTRSQSRHILKVPHWLPEALLLSFRKIAQK